MKPAKQMYCQLVAQRKKPLASTSCGLLSNWVVSQNPFAGVPQDVLAAPVLPATPGCNCLAALKWFLPAAGRLRSCLT